MTKKTTDDVTPIPDDILDRLLEGQDRDRILGKNGLVQKLVKGLLERALEGEMTEHLGYARGEPKPTGEANARNGTSKKTVRSELGSLPLKVPRDRQGAFEPQIVKKGQTRIDGLDDSIVALYARGLSVRDIQGQLQEIYGVDVSADLISRVTDEVVDEVKAWQVRPLDPVYPMVFFDALVVKIRDGALVKNRRVYLALGVNTDGQKELLGIWVMDTEGAKFWLKVVTELHNRGMQDILIACTDGLKGFPEAIESVFPDAVVQTCIVHVLRNSTRYVAWRDRRAVLGDLKGVYTAPTEKAAQEALDAFESKWQKSYPMVAQSWRANWERITPFLAFPPDLRRAIYTTNVLEAINRQARKVLKTKGHFPTEQAAVKLIYLVLRNASRKWGMPVRQWQKALNQLAIHFPGRLPA